MKLFHRTRDAVEAPAVPTAERTENQTLPPDSDRGRIDPTTLQTATFGAGCFWGVEEAYRQVDGVVDTAVGFSGGSTTDPSYKEVCTGRTGHAEVVQVTFDPSQVSYEKLLDVLWDNHNPTTRNRQGWDIGSQYRSVIFTRTPEQVDAAHRSVEQLEQSGRFRKPVVTEIIPFSEFYRAEDYHQQYLAKRGQGACHI
jgi:peptide-methionine (S)-S-oxide reductase